MVRIGSEESDRRGWGRLRRSASGLRARLLLVVILAVVPALGLIFYTAVRWRQHELADAQADAWRLARHAVALHERRIAETRDVLWGLAQTPTAWEGDPDVCRELLARRLAQFRFYVNLGVVRADGTAICSALPLDRSASSADRSAFGRVVESQAFSSGNSRIEEDSGRTLADFAAPIMGRGGRVRAVVFAVLDLAWLGGLVEEAGLPAGTTVTLFDDKGVILAHYPAPQGLVGRQAGAEAIFRLVRLSPWGGTADEAGLDGSRRLFGFQSMLDPSRGGIVHAAVGIPAADALGHADRILAENLTGLGLAAALALIAAWVGGSGLFLRRIDALVQATRRLSAGDLRARTPRASGAGELDVLAGAFNEMAAALEARTEETLRQSRALIDLERRFRALIENSSDGIFVVSGRRRVTYASPAIARILGYSVEEFVGRDLVALVRTADRPLVKRRFADVLRDPGLTAAVEVLVRHKDGSPRWVEAVIGNLLADPSVRGVVVNYRDITDRRQAAEALRATNEGLERQVAVRTAELVRSNRELQAALGERERASEALRKLSSAAEQTSDSLFIVNREGVIEYVNPAFERLTGYSREEVLGKTRRILSSGEHSPRFYAHLWGRIMAGEVFRGVFINRRRDGERYYEEETITPLRDGTGEITHFVCSGRDITRRQRTEEALRRLNDRLEKEAERIAHVFHDEAGQLLTSAHITLAEVARGLPPAMQGQLEKVRKVLDEVEEQLRHLTHEIRPRILDDLGLRAALEFLIEGVAKRTGLRVRMTFAADGPLPAMIETAVYRFAQEALTNAAKHARASEVSVVLEQEPGRIRCAVRDDGIGFDVPQDLTRPGAGLGLLGILDRVEALGGTVDIASGPGQGAELVAAIPLETSNEASNSAGGRSSTGEAGHPRHPGAGGI